MVLNKKAWRIPRISPADEVRKGGNAPERPKRAAAADQMFKGEQLRIFTYAGAWGDQFKKNFAPLFKEVTGADLIIELGWWDSIPKLKASPPGKPAFDLIMTDATQGYPAIREGLFQKANLTNVPNASKFTPAG